MLGECFNLTEYRSAVASYGGARYAAKAEIRAARRGNGSEAADDGSGVGELLPEPAVAA